MNRFTSIFLVFATYIQSQFVASSTSFDFKSLNLHPKHIPVFFHQYPEVGELCLNDSSCPYKEYVGKSVCWGYETYCDEASQFSVPRCEGSHKGWVKSKKEQVNTFFTQGDFGYIREQQKEMKIMCEPLYQSDSALECSSYLRFCRGRNLMINFTHLEKREKPIRYHMDVLHDGQIGGRCKFYADKLKSECQHMSPLQSWAPELRYFTELKESPIENESCDITIDRPTIVMKIDATVNMYHHFCDFFNLYASQHVNASHPSMFSDEIHILIWESYPYHSVFSSVWKAFTKYPIWSLKTFKGKSVCFRNIIFPLLPRMIFGLYYNTPLIWGCENSGLFRAFSQHLLHRLNIPFHPRTDNRIRITLLSRDTTYRKILNEKALLDALNNNPKYSIHRAVFTHLVPFEKQLEVIHNTDILIGMHGAGLTHLLFLPEWAVVFELYNCEDENCYLDLARLNGLKYITWQNKEKLKQQDKGHHPDGGAHAKFTNYEFDVPEFVRLVKIGENYLSKNKQFNELFTVKHDEF